jgi:hypothetical protein
MAGWHTTMIGDVQSSHLSEEGAVCCIPVQCPVRNVLVKIPSGSDVLRSRIPL